MIYTTGGYWCHADQVERPFAHSGSFNSMVAISDQTGDGVPDLLVSGNGGGGYIRLLTLDPSVIEVGVESSPEKSGQPTAVLQGSDLVVHLLEPAVVSALLSTLDGRVFPLLAARFYEQGLHRLSLAAALQSLPKGTVFVRVMISASVITLPILR